MKIIYIILNVSISDYFLEKLTETGLTDFQIIEKVSSRSSCGNPRMNTSVWPGYSSVFIIQSDDDRKIREIFDFINTHNNNRVNDDELIQAYIWGSDAVKVE